MDVEQILTQIQNLSLNNGATITDRELLLSYLNSAYREIYNDIARYNRFASISEIATFAKGVCSTKNAILKILSIKHLDAKMNRIKSYYLKQEQKIVVRPNISGNLEIKYIPYPNQLYSTSPAADIKVPSLFHDILVWATLFYIAYDERDNLLGSEFSIISTKYSTLKEQLLQYLTYPKIKKLQIAQY